MQGHGGSSLEVVGVGWSLVRGWALGTNFISAPAASTR
jgi:hypothetical protein